MKRCFLTTLVCLMLIASVAHGAIIHVPGDQPTIQAGIDASLYGDTVLVADGVYTGDGNKNLDFNGKTITVTSENGAESTIIDCERSGRGFYFHNGEYEASVVSGFTITNGYIDDDGGGICCEYSSSPTITNNTITNNLAEYVGGIYCEYSSSPTITNNTITNNSAHLFVGGLRCDSSSSPTITNTILWNNGPEEIYASSITVTYSDVQGGWPGEGNIDEDPMFVDPELGDYHLRASSPCIDAGTPDGAPQFRARYLLGALHKERL